MIPLEILIQHLEMGLIPIPLDKLSSTPTLSWGEIYNNPHFWSVEKLTQYVDKFYNVATTFGESSLRDALGRKQFLHCLDIDSEEVLKKVIKVLEEEWKLKTFVTKTQKDCGYHVYWFEHSDDKSAIVTDDCRKGFEFEIKCGKSLCTLPPSRHRDNPFFHYENIGQSDKIMIADGLYDKLVNDLLLDCLKKKKKEHKQRIKHENNSMLLDATIGTQTYTSIQFDPETITDSSKSAEFSNNELYTNKRIILTQKQIEKSIQDLLPYYVKGSRNSFTLGFAGLAYKELVAKSSCLKILEGICNRTKDSEKDSRLDTLHRTYCNGSENGMDAITGKTKLREVIGYISNCDEKSAEDIVQDLINIWSINQEAKNEQYDEDSTDCNYDTVDDNNSNHKQTFSISDSLSKELLTAKIHNASEYVISVINKTVKCDDSLVRAVFYAGCSTWTFDPINLGISAPTSEGKTYTVSQVLEYFPKKDVKKIGSMSPKVIIRQDSILVDADTLRPIQGDINALRKQIKREKNNEKRKEELEEKLQDLLANARPLIDLRGKIYVFLEPPSPELWNIIKPIMSHDSFVIEHPYVESNTFQGIHVRSIITLGFPTFIFCTAKDESRWEQWDEIVSRSLIMSPNMSSKKYRGSTILSAQQIGLPTAIQELLIRSKREVDLARKCMLYLKNSITEATTLQRQERNPSESHDFIYKNPVWIPYQEILGATLPSEKGTDMRTNRHLHLLLRIIALAKTNQQYQVIFDNQTLTVAAPEDLTEALYITQNSSGLPPYKAKFFNEIFYPLYKKKLNEKLREQEQFRKDIIVERGDKKFDNAVVAQAVSAVTLTANEVCDYYNLRNPKAPTNSDNLRKKYLNELVSAAWVEALDVQQGNTKKCIIL